MDAAAYVDDQYRRESRPLGLVTTVLLLAACAAFLNAVAGPPHLPAGIPSWTTILLTLQGSDVPLEALAYLFSTSAWLLWLWLVGSLLLRFIAVAADTVTRGAAWARSLRAVSDRITLPIVRRVVDGAVVAVVVVNLVARSPAAEAAPDQAPIVLVASRPTTPGQAMPMPDHHAPNAALDRTEYVVQPGDTLWSISERFYGTGEEFPRLVEANADHRMPDGRVFTRAGMIQPGWVLEVPLPSQRIQVADGKTWYVVESGDTLRGVAARFIGDENKWPVIFDLNRDSARMPDGRVLKDPDLIWPGLRLRLPDKPSAPSVATPPAPHVIVPAAPTVVPPVPVAPVVPTRAPARAPLPTAVSTPVSRPTPTPTLPRRSADHPATPETVPTPALYGAAGALAAVAGAALIARRRFRRSLDEPPVPPSTPATPSDEFADAEFARALAYRLQSGEVEPVAVAARFVLEYLREHGITRSSVIMAQQARRGIALVLSTGLADHARIIELAEEIGNRLGGRAVGTLTPDRDVVLKIANPNLAGVTSDRPGDSDEPTWLVPLGVLPGGQTLFVNYRECGNLLVAGLPGGGVDVVLTSLISALASHAPPDHLELRTIASRRRLPPPLAILPHQRHGFVDPEDSEGVAAILQLLRMELLRRMSAEQPGTRETTQYPTRNPEIVLVVGELGELCDDGTTFEMLGVHGPAHGIHLLAATTGAGEPNNDLLTHFGTRLVLQTLDDEESIVVLGQPEAATLGSAEFYARIDGRLPLRARGFRVSADHLDELVRLTSDAWSRHDLHSVEDAATPDEEEEQGSSRPTLDDASAPANSGVTASSVARAADGIASDASSRLNDELRAEDSGRDAGMRDEVSADRAESSDALNRLDPDRVPGTDGHWSSVPARPSELPSDEMSGGRASLNGWSPGGDASGANGEEGGEPVRDAARAANVHGVHVDQDRRIEVRCFGPFTVTYDGREISPQSGGTGVSHTGWEILAFLAAQREGKATKEDLIAAIWEEVDYDLAVTRMHTAISRLRQMLRRQVPDLPDEAVRCDRDGYCRLDPRWITSDVRQFSVLYEGASRLPSDRQEEALIRARALYRGDLLAGHGLRRYEWVDAPSSLHGSLRQRYREQYIQVTRRLASRYRAEGRPDQAVTLYRTLLSMIPTLEDVVRDLFACYGQLDDLQGLVRAERELRLALRAAYFDLNDPEAGEIEPQSETVELFERIRGEIEIRREQGVETPPASPVGRRS